MLTANNLNPIPLNTCGYDSRYILFPNGTVLNTKTNKLMPMYKRNFYLRRLDGSYKTVSLKTLYRQCYNKEYCIDDIQDLPNEVWRNVVLDTNDDTSGYLVSNLGRVKSILGYKAIILKETINESGYCVVEIHGKPCRVHRLVAFAFIPNDDKTKDTVDHRDNNRRNNKVTNLQWLSRLDNIRKEWDGRKLDKERKKSKTSQSL